MNYKDNYEKYLNEIPDIIEYSIEHQKAPVFGYTSNYDVVLHWNVTKYNEILKEYLKEEPSVKEGDTIGSMEDFARITASYLMKGIGGNFDITTIDVCNFLQDSFLSEYALGGTCAQGAAAIGSMGFPVNIHITDDSEEVCRMIDYPGATLIHEGHKVPVMEGKTDAEPIYHFILQFDKDDKLNILGKEVTIPNSNRLILFFDKLQKIVPIKKEFMDYWENADESPSSYSISGFDAIVEESIMNERLKELEPHLRRMKEKDPEMILYFEGAFYMNSKVKAMASNVFCKYADILGMNEEELQEQVERFQGKVDVTSSKSIIEALDLVLSQYPAKGITLHTKDYSLYYGTDIQGVNLEQGLTIGNLMSATRARIGKYGTVEECRETLSLPLSETGLRFSKELEPEHNHKKIVIVPSKYMEHPVYTIGLGDTFVSGVHTCFIKR